MGKRNWRQKAKVKLRSDAEVQRIDLLIKAATQKDKILARTYGSDSVVNDELINRVRQVATDFFKP